MSSAERKFDPATPVHDGKEKDYGAFALAEGDTRDLFKLVDACGFDKLESTTKERAGGGCEFWHTFTLKRGDEVRTVQLWWNDARENKAVTALLEKLRDLIEKHAKEKVALG